VIADRQALVTEALRQYLAQAGRGNYRT